MPKFYVEINNEVDFYINLYDHEVAERFYQAHADVKQKHPDWAQARL